MARCWTVLVLAAWGLPGALAARSSSGALAPGDYGLPSFPFVGTKNSTEVSASSRAGYRSCSLESLPRWTPLLTDGRILGQGTTGQVRFYRLQSPCKGKVVVKELNGVDEEDMDREIELYKLFGSHPNIVRLYDYKRDEFRLCAHLLMEPALGGELPNAYRRTLPSRVLSTFHLTRNRDRAKAKILSMALVGLLSGLAHMHKYGVLHLDMKPENIYGAESGNACIKTRSCRYLIGDLGAAARMQTLTLSDGTTIQGVECNRKGEFKCPGTYRWQPPEARGGALWAPHGSWGAPEPMEPFWTDKGDVWALGMSLHEVISPIANVLVNGADAELCAQGGMPHPACLQSQLMLVQQKEYLPQGLKTLLSWMVAHNWQDRPTAREALDYAKTVVEPRYGVFHAPAPLTPPCVTKCKSCQEESLCRVSKHSMSCTTVSRLDTTMDLSRLGTSSGSDDFDRNSSGSEGLFDYRLSRL